MDREILCSSRTLQFPTRAQWHLLCTLAAIIEPAGNEGGFRMRSTTVCSKTSRDQAKSLCIDAATFRARSGGLACLGASQDCGRKEPTFPAQALFYGSHWSGTSAQLF